MSKRVNRNRRNRRTRRRKLKAHDRGDNRHVKSAAYERKSLRKLGIPTLPGSRSRGGRAIGRGSG